MAKELRNAALTMILILLASHIEHYLIAASFFNLQNESFWTFIFGSNLNFGALHSLDVATICDRKLKLSGQRLGATAVICHLERHEASNQMNHFTLSIANVGDTEAVLCHRGEAVVLTRKFTTTAEREECQRIYKSDGIITEVVHCIHRLLSSLVKA